MSLAKLARDFFVERNVPSPTELVMKWDALTIQRMLGFGQRASHEAQVMATKLLLQGNKKEADLVAQDVTVIQKNLNSVSMAHKMSINWQMN